MFTGLIAEVAQVVAVQTIQGDVRLTIAVTQSHQAELGASIAINGVCLTLVEQQTLGTQLQWAFDVSNESLSRTGLQGIQVGAYVNIELSLTPSTPMGGHWVSGHVDGIGQVSAVSSNARAQDWTIAFPESLAPFIAEKGSIALDGISLTVNRVGELDLDVTIIPHTHQQTTIQYWQVGTQINIEVDMLARYLFRFMQTAQPGSALSKDQLSAWGYGV